MEESSIYYIYHTESETTTGPYYGNQLQGLIDEGFLKENDYLADESQEWYFAHTWDTLDFKPKPKVKPKAVRSRKKIVRQTNKTYQKSVKKKSSSGKVCLALLLLSGVSVGALWYLPETRPHVVEFGEKILDLKEQFLGDSSTSAAIPQTVSKEPSVPVPQENYNIDVFELAGTEVTAESESSSSDIETLTEVKPTEVLGGGMIEKTEKIFVAPKVTKVVSKTFDQKLEDIFAWRGIKPLPKDEGQVMQRVIKVGAKIGSQ